MDVRVAQPISNAAISSFGSSLARMINHAWQSSPQIKIAGSQEIQIFGRTSRLADSFSLRALI